MTKSWDAFLPATVPAGGDGSRSFSSPAPDGSSPGPLVQIIYHRPLSE